MDQLIVDVWPSDFGLPSVDCNCLHFMLCSRMCAAPIKFVKATKPWKSPSGTFPVFKSGPELQITDFNLFKNYVKRNVTANCLVFSYNSLFKEVSLDHEYSSEVLLDTVAYESLLMEKLLPAYIFMLWIDNANFNVFTNRWYGRQIIFPFGLYFIARQRHLANRHIRAIFPSDFYSMEDIEYIVTKQAINCMNQLSKKLGDNKYFYGDKPSFLDVLVVGYLAPLLKLPLPNDRLQLHLKSCINLVQLIDSTLRIYLPLNEEEIAEQQETEKEWEKRKLAAQARMQTAKHFATERSGEHDSEFLLRDKIFFGIGAALITILFALHFGIIKVELLTPKTERDERQTLLPAEIESPE